MSKKIILFVLVSLFSTSCGLIEEIWQGENSTNIIKISFAKKNVVFDLNNNGQCASPIVIKMPNNEFYSTPDDLYFFVRISPCYKNNQYCKPPTIFWSSLGLSFEQIESPKFIFTTDCRLIASANEDSLDENGDVSLDFTIINLLSGDEAVVQGKYKPSEFIYFEECNSDGAYRISGFPQVSVCFNSLPVNEIVEFEPPVSTEYIEEQVRELYDNVYLGLQCIGDTPL